MPLSGRRPCPWVLSDLPLGTRHTPEQFPKAQSDLFNRIKRLASDAKGKMQTGARTHDLGGPIVAFG